MASGDPQNINQKPSEPSASRSLKSRKPVVKKGKAGSSKKMTQKEQSERFIQTAQEMEADESGKCFNEIIATISKVRLE